MPKSLSSLLPSILRAAAKDLRPRAPELETTVQPTVCTQSSSPPGRGEGFSLEQPKKDSSRVSSQVLRLLNQATSNNSKTAASDAESSVLEISSVISSILHRRDNDTSSPLSSSKVNDEMKPQFSSVSPTNLKLLKLEKTKQRKQKYIFEKTQSRRFTKLMEMCANKVGTESTIEFFANIGRPTGVNEYNALLLICIDKARQSNDKESLLGQIDNAYRLFLSMKEKGFQISEETFGPFLKFMIEMELAEKFQFFCNFFKDENPQCCARIGFYEMLFYIRVGDEHKIRELCDSNIVAGNENFYSLAESYLLAFCESDRKEELFQLLEVIDIMHISSPKYKASIFKSLGRLKLEKHAEKFILQLKTAGTEDEDISVFIYEYVSSLPNLAAEVIVSNFSSFHKKFGVVPAASSSNNLITFCCDLGEIPAALDVADYMCEYGLIVPIEAIHQMLHVCGQCCEPQMVYPIYFMMQRHNLRPKGETLKRMISLHVKMKDFEGAYNLLKEMIEMNESPTTSMYNTILAGYFREKNNVGAKIVLKQMKDANIKPDSETFSYLISNCEREADIAEYCDQMHLAGIKASKYIYMALINAYANFQNFERAKEIVLDHEIRPSIINEIKSVLVSALSSNGQIYDALDVFDEIKQGGCNVDIKAVISLIENLQVDGQLDRLLQLLEELNGSSSWFDGCSRVIIYCVSHNIPEIAVKLLKQLKEKDIFSTYIVVDQIFSQIWETEPANLEIGLELFRAIKEELEIHPSRTSLDFLLGTCVKTKDSKSAQILWSEYEKAGLPYNFLTYLRMYEALLASGDFKAARRLLKKISKEDADVRLIIQSCRETFLAKK